jgi:DNA repair protein RadC
MTMLYVRESKTQYRLATSDELAHALTKTLEQHFDRMSLNSPAKINAYLSARYALNTNETFGMLVLDTQLQLIAVEEVGQGTTNYVQVSPRRIVECLLTQYPQCTRIAVFHNHPSGSTEASMADLHITRRLKTALAIVEIELIDHFIIAGTEVVSMRQKGLMD